MSSEGIEMTNGAPATNSGRNSTERSNNSLLRELRTIHIVAIGISGTIALGLYGSAGHILGTAGPAAVIIAYSVVGIVAYAVMQGLGEMLCLWPIANALVEYVRVFVDEDLSYLVGFTYWYTYAVGFVSLILDCWYLSEYWGGSPPARALVLFLFCPFLLVWINHWQVYVYGFSEVVGAAIKLAFAVGVIILLICINRGVSGDPEGGPVLGTSLFDEAAFPYIDRRVGTAICDAIAKAGFAYIGVELYAMTAFEAHKASESLNHATRIILRLVVSIYVLSASIVVFNVKWDDEMLSKSYKDDIKPYEQSSSVFVQSAISSGIPKLPGFLTVVLIIVVLSAANTALYVASRTLYGLARMSSNANAPWKYLGFFAEVNKNQVPMAAIYATVLPLLFLPFLILTKKEEVKDLLDILTTIGSVGCVLVWAAESFAYIRFYHCAVLWEDPSFKKGFASFFGPGILILMYGAMKFIKWCRGHTVWSPANLDHSDEVQNLFSDLNNLSIR